MLHLCATADKLRFPQEPQFCRIGPSNVLVMGSAVHGFCNYSSAANQANAFSLVFFIPNSHACKSLANPKQEQLLFVYQSTIISLFRMLQYAKHLLLLDQRGKSSIEGISAIKKSAFINWADLPCYRQLDYQLRGKRKVSLNAGCGKRKALLSIERVNNRGHGSIAGGYVSSLLPSVLSCFHKIQTQKFFSRFRTFHPWIVSCAHPLIKLSNLPVFLFSFLFILELVSWCARLLDGNL